MSVDWGVVPIVPETYEWLQEAGYNTSSLESRFPTLEEMLLVLESFNDLLPITKSNYADEGWTLTVGTVEVSQYACILGSVQEDRLFHFHFFGSRCQEETMLEILKRLAPVCGPLTLYESIAATPLVVTEDMDVQIALEEWHTRMKQNYSTSSWYNQKRGSKK